MTKITITCLACENPSVWNSDEEYKTHLLEDHGATTSQQAMNNEKNKKLNTPAVLPPGITANMLPNKDFMDSVKRIESSPVAPPPPVQIQTDNTMIPVKTESKPIILKYKYDGNCLKCEAQVKTIMIQSNGVLTASAYCINCDEILKQIEVSPIIQRKEEHGNKSTEAQLSRSKKVRSVSKTKSISLPNSS